MGERKITLKDISERAGVAVSTVSMVLNNKTLEGRVRISDQTVRKVRKIAQEMGYLSARQTLVGLVMTHFRDATETPIVQSIIEQLRCEDNCHLAMGLTTKADPKLELEELHFMDQKGFDGMIMEPSFALMKQIEKQPEIFASWKNVVFINRYPFGDIPCVTIDHRKCGYLAGQHLVDKGHRHIAFMEGHYDAVPTSYVPECEKQIVYDRWAGFSEALGERDVSSRLVQGVDDLLAIQKEVTAVYCAHTRGATALLSKCWHLGLSVPDALSIVGQDDEVAKEVSMPSITTVGGRARAVGERAAHMVFDLISGKVPKSVILEPYLAERESVLAL